MNEQERGCAAPLTARAQAFALEAQETIAANRRMLQAHGLTPESCLAALRNAGGEAAAGKAWHAAQETLRALDEKIAREVMHMPAPARAQPRHLARLLAAI
jgi:hypothetical protein